MLHFEMKQGVDKQSTLKIVKIHVYRCY